MKRAWCSDDFWRTGCRLLVGGVSGCFAEDFLGCHCQRASERIAFSRRHDSADLSEPVGRVIKAL
jgi:hypothetical protein